MQGSCRSLCHLRGPLRVNNLLSAGRVEREQLFPAGDCCERIIDAVIMFPIAKWPRAFKTTPNRSLYSCHPNNECCSVIFIHSTQSILLLSLDSFLAFCRRIFKIYFLLRVSTPSRDWTDKASSYCCSASLLLFAVIVHFSITAALSYSSPQVFAAFQDCFSAFLSFRWRHKSF